MKALRLGLVAVAVFASLGTVVGCSESSSPSQPEHNWDFVGFFGIDPAATFLHTCNDPGALDSQPIVLADHGLTPGTTIRIQSVGHFSAGGADSDGLEAIFSASSTLLDGSELNRVVDAIDAGTDYQSSPTNNCGGEPTDIPEDFACTPEVTVTIPAGATHLFLAARDTYFGDNSDTDGDFGANISERE